MKKLAYLLFSLILLVGVSNAQSLQSRSILTFNVPLNFPLGDFSDAAGTGYGLTADFEFGLGGSWSGTVTSGYLAFAESNGFTYSAIPLVVGAKLYLSGGWYGNLETGFHFYSFDGPFGISDSKTEWGFALGTGYAIALSDNIGLDVSTKYQYNGDNLSYWNTNLGLMFGL